MCEVLGVEREVWRAADLDKQGLGCGKRAHNPIRNGSGDGEGTLMSVREGHSAYGSGRRKMHEDSMVPT